MARWCTTSSKISSANDRTGPFDAEAEERLLELGREDFAAHSDFPEVIALWWPRFEKIARWFVRTESEWTDVAERHVELTRRDVGAGWFRAHRSRADRLDVLAGGESPSSTTRPAQPLR